MQTERLEKLQEANRNWFDRMQAEVELASEFAAKLTMAHSIPEAATAYQEWTSRHMEMATEAHLRRWSEISGDRGMFVLQRLVVQWTRRRQHVNRVTWPTSH